MSRRVGTCADAGPGRLHCSDETGLGHRFSHYDAGQDESWNDGTWVDFYDCAPHDCDDEACPDKGARPPVHPKDCDCEGEADV